MKSMNSQARLLLSFLVCMALALVGFIGAPAPHAAAAGLSLDASSPSVVKKKGNTLTTARFTPPAGSVLVISAQTSSTGAADVKSITVTDNLTTHLTYAQVQAQGNTSNDVYAKLYWAAVTTSRQMTVTARMGGSNSDYGMLSVLVFTGANVGAPIGASGGGRAATGAISDTYTATAGGSWGWMSYGDGAQGGVPTVPVGETVHASYNVAGHDTFALIKQKTTAEAAGTPVTMSTVTPASGTNTTHLYFEVLPAPPPAPSAPAISTFTASPGSISAGQSSTLSWSVSGSPAPTLSIDNGVGDVSGLASKAVSPSQTTTYTLTATNSHGTTSATTMVTVSAPDTSPPTVPSGVTATAVSSSQVNLAWTRSSDNVGVSGYRVLRGGTEVGTSATTIFPDTGLASSTTYSYTVRAYDAAGNVSADSATVSATTLPTSSSGPEPAGWYAGDMHVHRSCGGTAEPTSGFLSKMEAEDLRFISLLADCGNGEVQNPTTDLPLVNGQDASLSTATRTIHWDAEWHWDATYSQYAHQALGGHLVNLGLNSASQIWQEYTYPVISWAHANGGISGFAHMQYLPSGIPQTLDCCTPIEYPVEVALGSADFISEDVRSDGDTAIEAYYRLLNDGFRPGFAAGTDYPCGNSSVGSLLTYSLIGSGDVSYRNWIAAIKSGRTVISRNGHNEFLDLVVDGTAGPGGQVNLASSGSVPVTVTWTATQSYTGTVQLVQNGVVVASKQATVTAGSPVTLTATVDFAKSGWLAARRMSAEGHQVHTAAAFVMVNSAPIRASAADAQFYVDWMDNLLAKTSPGGEWNHYFVNNLAEAQSRYQQAKAVFQQIKQEASSPAAPVISSFSASPATVLPGQSATLSWAVSGNPTPSVTIDNGVGDVSGVTSRAVSPSQTTTYTLTARNSLGTVTSTATVTVSASQNLPQTIFTTEMPAGSYSDGASVNYELGTRFTSVIAGQITAIRFYKSASESGTHTGRIWSASGQQLASVVFSGESASGWQQQVLATPLAITANTEYMVTVNTGNTYYSATDGGLTSQISSGDLRTVLGSNGRYGPVGSYPTSSWQDSSYFRDVVFTR